MAHSLTANLSHTKYRPDIDGLRAVAILSVVAFHALPGWIRGGFIGVDIFFVISGFLISTIIFEGLEKEAFNFSEFYFRRILRIFPALIFVFFVCLAFGWMVLIPDELNQLGKHIFAGTLFISNFILWSEVDYFDNAAETKPLLHLWSLGIEEQFYIIWPLLLWFSWRKKLNLPVVVVAITALSFYLNLSGIDEEPVATFFSPHTRFWELLIGSLLAWFVLYKKSLYLHLQEEIDFWLDKLTYRLHNKKIDNFLSDCVSCLGCLLLAYGFYRINGDIHFPGKWAILPVAGTALIILAGPQSWINKNLLSRKTLVWLGLISFPLYLWHWPVLSFARIIENETPRIEIRIAAIAISIILAWGTAKFVEKPLRFTVGKNARKATVLIGSMAFISVLGFIASRSDFSLSHGFEKTLIERKGFEHGFGSSLAWLRGKDNWLFLGNEYENIVAKLKGSIEPSSHQLKDNKDIHSKLVNVATENGIKVALLIAPNKSTIYPEYLPNELTPSSKRYLDSFMENFHEISQLTAYDPTSNLKRSKNSEELIYSRTDSHWNQKGAFIAYSGLLRKLEIPAPEVAFKIGAVRAGDLVKISKLENFPLSKGDNFEFSLQETPILRETYIPNERKTPFGVASVITNEKPLSNKYVWVIGDSFTTALRSYLNATFKEIRYVGHWAIK